MPLQKLKEFLDSRNVNYEVISHSVAYTAPEVAALAHIPGKELAKTVIVKIDGALAMAVVSASQHVDLASLKAATAAKTVDLATEGEFRERFSDCEVGAMPPFGNLYGMPVFVDESLSRDQEIVFNAGSHSELVRIAWADFEKVVQPRVMRIASGKRAGEAA